MQIIPRENYAARIDAWIGKEQIVVLTGQRRVGKSYVMKDFAQRHRQESDANIIYIDKEKVAFKYITNGNELDHRQTELCFKHRKIHEVAGGGDIRKYRYQLFGIFYRSISYGECATLRHPRQKAVGDGRKDILR